MYVTDIILHNVSMFTTERSYVTSFGHYGSEEGCFRYPQGLHVDRDGFVYVANIYNNRVQVF